MRQTKGWQHSLQPQSWEMVLGTTVAPSRPASIGGMCSFPRPSILPSILPSLPRLSLHGLFLL